MCTMVQRGDVLLAVNDISLINLTHNEAVQCLKSSSTQSRRVLHVLQVGQPSTSAALGTVNFRPMWTYWLSLPSYVYNVTFRIRSASSILRWNVSVLDCEKKQQDCV